MCAVLSSCLLEESTNILCKNVTLFQIMKFVYVFLMQNEPHQISFHQIHNDHDMTKKCLSMRMYQMDLFTGNTENLCHKFSIWMTNIHTEI